MDPAQLAAYRHRQPLPAPAEPRFAYETTRYTPYLWLQPPAGLTEALSMSGSPPFDPPSPVLMDISPDTRFPVPVPPADEPVVVSSSTEPTSTSAPPMEDRELSLPTAEVTSPLLESPVARAASPSPPETSAPVPPSSLDAASTLIQLSEGFGIPHLLLGTVPAPAPVVTAAPFIQQSLAAPAVAASASVTVAPASASNLLVPIAPAPSSSASLQSLSALARRFQRLPGVVGALVIPPSPSEAEVPRLFLPSGSSTPVPKDMEVVVGSSSGPPVAALQGISSSILFLRVLITFRFSLEPASSPARDDISQDADVEPDQLDSSDRETSHRHTRQQKGKGKAAEPRKCS